MSFYVDPFIFICISEFLPDPHVFDPCCKLLFEFRRKHGQYQIKAYDFKTLLASLAVAQQRVYSTRRQVSLKFIDNYSSQLSVDLIDWFSQFASIQLVCHDKRQNKLFTNLLINVRTLKFRCQSDEDLQRISHLINLEKIELMEGRRDTLTYLDPIGKMESLRHLQISGYKTLSDISPLAKIKHILYLDLSHTATQRLQALEGLKTLRVLKLEETQITNSDLEKIRNLKNLRELNISCTAVSCIEPLKDLIQISTLRINNTRVETLADISGLRNIELLVAGNTEISSVIPLAGMVKLQELYLGSTKVNDVRLLATLPCLKNLDISRTLVKRVGCLRNAPALKRLRLYGNEGMDMIEVATLLKIPHFYISAYDIFCSLMWPDRLGRAYVAGVCR